MASPISDPDIAMGVVVDAKENEFFYSVVAWQRLHGRNSLPWQNTKDPYRVWVSEIMLQQTQVSAVIGYYEKFIDAYPDVFELARANLDDVFRLWSGLGYYTRARNLLRSARLIVDRYGGVFPRCVDELTSLPGVGFSTAAAIASFCFGDNVSIFDGNVKRVLARYVGFSEDLSLSRSAAVLQDIAQDFLPKSTASAEDMAAYTQGLMDLGSMVCRPARTFCHDCPVQAGCLGYQRKTPLMFPVKSKKIKKRLVCWHMWIFCRGDGRFWLEKRPEDGIWAGLYCFPVTLENVDPLGAPSLFVDRQGEFSHALTHIDIHVSYYMVPLPSNLSSSDYFQSSGAWAEIEDIRKIGVPQPVRRIVDALS